MKVRHLHPWNVSTAEAIGIQKELNEKVSRENEFGEVRFVAGVDISVKGDVAKAAVVVLRYPDLKPVEGSLAELPVELPYIPGLLSFRESPSIIAAFEKLSTEPDLVVADGQGIAHPRRLGIASHLGLLLDRPTIGCAKSRLCGKHDEPGWKAGCYTYLFDNNEIIGAALRTRDKTKVVYISIGHKIDLKTSIEYVLGCCRGYRLPETTRFAHRVAGGMEFPKAGPEQLSLL